MVSGGTRSERKTAYFYETKNISTGFQIDRFFSKAYMTSQQGVGEKIQYWMKQKLDYEASFGKVITRESCKKSEFDYFIEASDDETCSDAVVEDIVET